MGRLLRLERDMRAHNEWIGPLGESRYVNISADTVVWIDGDLRGGDVLMVLDTGETIRVRHVYEPGVYRVERGIGAALPLYAHEGADLIAIRPDSATRPPQTE